MQYIGRFARLFKRDKFNPNDDVILSVHKNALKHIPEHPPRIDSPSDLNVNIFGNPIYNVTIEPKGNPIEFVVRYLTEQGYLGSFVVTDRFFMLPGHLSSLEERKAYIDLRDPFGQELTLMHLEEAGVDKGLTDAYRRLSKEIINPRSDIVVPGIGVVSGHIHYGGGGIHNIRRNGRYKILT